MIKYTDEQRQFLIDNNYMRTGMELSDLFYDKFEIRLTKQNIKCFRTNHKLNSGLTGRFEKGHKTHNKGKKWCEYMSSQGQTNSLKTTFKKGQMPHNYRPVGSERISKDGYVEIKIADPDKWQLKHRYIYEQKYGKIKEGYNLIFLDGNKQNLELSNLKLVSKAEDLIMNNNKLFSTDKDITNTGTLIANVICKTNELLKKEGE